MSDPTIIILYVVVFVIAVFITRAVFSIGNIVKNLQIQTRLLMKIAEQQGVTKEEVDIITG